MRKTKIAVIDDGIDKEIIEDALCINFVWHSKGEEGKCYIRHGTKVVCTIEKYYSGPKEYYIYNIMDTKEKSCSRAVLAALKELLIHKVDIILMCLVIQNSEIIEEITEIIDELKRMGTIIIVSASNSDERSFPAQLDGVIGVGRMVSQKYGWIWRGRSSIQILGDVTPEFLRIGKGKRTIFSGTSKAAAKVAAVVLKECEGEIKTVSQIMQFFKGGSQREYNLLREIENREYKNSLQYEDIYKKISIVMQKMGYCLVGDGGDYYFEELVNNIDEFGELILEILDTFDIYVVPEQMHYIDFMSAYALSNYLGKYNERNYTSKD